MSAPHILIWNRLPPTASGKSNLNKPATGPLHCTNVLCCRSDVYLYIFSSSYRIFAFSSKAVHLEPRQLPGPAVPGLPCHVPEAQMGRRGCKGPFCMGRALQHIVHQAASAPGSPMIGSNLWIQRPLLHSGCAVFSAVWVQYHTATEQ